MENLCELVACLKQSETRALKAQYMVKERGEPDLRGKLLQLILDKRVLTDEQASQAIYKSKPGSSFSHLKNRLWEDICSLLAFQDSGSRSAQDNARKEVSHLIHVARVLKERELFSQAFELSKQALDLALKFTLVPELLTLKEFISSSFPDFWITERSRIISLLSVSVKRESEFLHASHIAERISHPEEGTRHVAELEMLYRSSSCQQIKSLVHRSMINLHLEANNKDQLIKECILLYSICLNTDNHMLSEDKVQTFADITRAALRVLSFDSAVEFGRAGVEHKCENLLLEVELRESLFIALLNLGLYEDAHQLLMELETYYRRTDQLSSKALRFTYLKTWFYLLSGDSKYCLRSLSQLSSLPKGRELWHAGFYVLELIALLKQKTFFQLDYKNESFKKYIVRHGFEKDPALNFVWRTFKVFIDNDYDRKAVLQYVDAVNFTSSDRDVFCLQVVELHSVLREAFLSSK